MRSFQFRNIDIAARKKKKNFWLVPRAKMAVLVYPDAWSTYYNNWLLNFLVISKVYEQLSGKLNVYYGLSLGQVRRPEMLLDGFKKEQAGLNSKYAVHTES